MPVVYVSGANFSAAGLGKYPTNSKFYQDEMKAVLSANVLTSLSTHANAAKHKEALNNLIIKLKVSGVWAKLDFLFIPWLSQNKGEMKFNLKTATNVPSLLIPGDQIATCNFGFRHLQTTGAATTNEEKNGIIMPYTYQYDYKDFHMSIYHNNVGATRENPVFGRSTNSSVGGSTVGNNNFYTFYSASNLLSAQMGYANDVNRIQFPAFDANFSGAAKKLITFTTTVESTVMKGRTFLTGNSAAGQYSEVTIPTGYFTEIGWSFFSFLQGESAQYKCNACVISAGKGLSIAQVASYRQACDDMDAELLGVLPVFPLY